MKKLISIALLGLIAVSCTQGNNESVKAKKADSGVSVSDATYLAKVNDVVIKEADVRNEFRMLPFQVQELFSAQGGMGSLLEELIKKEILYQEARKRSYPSDEEFRKREADFRKRLLIEFLLEEEVEKKSAVNASDIEEYYANNRQDFVMEVPGTDETQSIEFEAVAELIRQKLVAERQQQVFDSYIEELKKTYSVELNKEAVSSAFGNGTAQ